MWKSGTRHHTAPCPKPTSLGIPLDVTSAHPPRVHLSWPVGTISRVQGLSTHREHAEAAKVTLVNRFRRHHALLFLIDLLNSTPAWEVEFWTHSVSQVPSFVASLRFPSHIAPNLEQSSCGPVKMCTVETTLQHGFWCRVSLCAPVVVQCTSFTGNHHQTVRQEVGLVVG